MTVAENPLPPKTVRLAKMAVAAVLLAALAGLSFSGTARFSDAQSLWQDTIRRNPGAWMAHGNLARLLASQGLHSDALAHYRAVTEIRPDLADGFFNLGVEYFATGQPEDAEIHFRKALAINPRLSEAHQALGFDLIQTGRPKEALASFLMVTALHPRRSEGHYGAGLAQAALGRPQKALDEFLLAQKFMDSKTPAIDRAEVLLQKGISLERLGRLTDALGSYREAVLAAPDYHRPLHRMGATLARLGHLEEAADALKRSLEIAPGYVPAQKDLKIVLDRRKGRGYNSGN